MEIGSRIQFYRMRLGLSQEALAEKLGVSRQSVSKWELSHALPDLDKVVLLSRLFNITTDELILDEPPSLPTRQTLRWGLYLWINDLLQEHRRIKSLKLGPTTEIIRPNCHYFFFNVTDPDENIIEITGEYKKRSE
jgi:transcriptional regulator with XRE-family HTH domain